MTVSIGVSQGPQHAMNPRELVACAEAAMMTAKAHGKNQTVLYDDGATERPAPTAVTTARDVRSIAHLKMLQSLAGKLNRLNDVRQIGSTIATELRLLIDYHNCRVVLRDGDDLLPIAFVGDHDPNVSSAADAYTLKVGEGITGRAVATGEALLVPNALECEFAKRIPGTDELEESLAAVPLRYGSRVTGAIVISKLGTDEFDEDDVRLLEVLAGQASVALENARLYEQQRREAEGAKALLAFADELSQASSFDEICRLTAGDGVLALRDRARLALDRRRVRRARRRAARVRCLRGAPGGRRRAPAASCSTSSRSTRIATACSHRSPTRRRSRCRRRASTGSSSKRPRSRTRCSTRAASSRPPSRPKRCSAAAPR